MVVIDKSRFISATRTASRSLRRNTNVDSRKLNIFIVNARARVEKILFEDIQTILINQKSIIGIIIYLENKSVKQAKEICAPNPLTESYTLSLHHKTLLDNS